MNKEQYQEVYEKAKQDGLTLHKSLRRKEIDGIYGMYAEQPIKRNTVLARFPKNAVLMPSSRYSQNLSRDIRYALTALHELEKGHKSKFWHFFYGLESEKDLKELSVFYFSGAQLSYLNKLNPLLYTRATQFKEFILSACKQIVDVEPSIDPRQAINILLNMQSRSWSDCGFMPIMDLFNHSDEHGLERQQDKASYFFLAKRDVLPGEQVFIRYSKQDIYQYAIAYNYFDPTDRHYLNFGYRFVQHAKTPFELEVAKYSSAKHPLKLFENNNRLNYQLINKDANFTLAGPSPQLVDYIRDNCFQTIQELKTGICSNESFQQRYREALDALLDANNIESASRQDCPKPLVRFYDVLEKEKLILEACIEWVG